MRIFLIVFLLPLLSHGQIIYKAKIISSTTKQSVPYATVALLRANIGVNADENGQFMLRVTNDIVGDTLIVSCVGYELLKIPARNLSETIILHEKPIDLSEVKVTSKLQWTFTKLHDIGCGDRGITTDGFQTQIAQFFTAPFDNSILTEVEICKSNSLFISHKSLFRLRFYDMDSTTKSPNKEIFNQVVEVNTSNKKTKVNLEKYKIYVSKHFFIAIEWLKIKYNEDKYTIMKEGKKIEQITFRPLIRFNSNFQADGKVTLGETYNVWSLFYQGKWSPSPWISDLSISATVKH